MDLSLAFAIQDTLTYSMSIFGYSDVYKDKIETVNKLFAINFDNEFEPLFIDSFKLELSNIALLNHMARVVVVSVLIISLIFGSYYTSALYLYYYENNKEIRNRPINILILIQIAIKHLTCLFMVSFWVIGLCFNITFSKHLGDVWCNVPWYVQVFSAGYRNIGRLGIAIDRVLLMKCNLWVKDVGQMKLILVILSLSLIIPVLLSVGFGVGNGPLSRQQPVWNFCTGKSEVFREIEDNYALLTGEIYPEVEIIPKLVLVVCLASAMAELICYIWYFLHLHLHDKKMLRRKVFEVDELKRRKQKNAITFLGQFYGFLIEFILYMCLMITLKENSDILHRDILALLYVVEFSSSSIVQVITSKTLRPYLLHVRFAH